MAVLLQASGVAVTCTARKAGASSAPMIIGTVKIKISANYREPQAAADRRALIWFRDVERMRSNLGVRAATAHFELGRWVSGFESGDLPGDALLKALAAAD